GLGDVYKRQERDSSTLLKYQEEEYNEQMENISKIIARQLNIDFIESEAHKKSWIQKIIFK
ncbi:MAG: hypothetical protein N2376_08745, partial [Clostridia bacterium]|nr:hypothetical protein [Clostridia bacterium]